MTIRTALRKLYTAMCGGTTNESTAGDLINAIATDYTGGGGGSDLPAPGTVGNVLTSTGEAWQSAAPTTVTVDANPTEDSEHAVSSGGVYTALSGKQATLTWDDAPTENSTHPVTSGGIYNALLHKGAIFKITGTVDPSTWAVSNLTSSFAQIATAIEYYDIVKLRLTDANPANMVVEAYVAEQTSGAIIFGCVLTGPSQKPTMVTITVASDDTATVAFNDGSGT